MRANAERGQTRRNKVWQGESGGKTKEEERLVSWRWMPKKHREGQRRKNSDKMKGVREGRYKKKLFPKDASLQL